MSPDPVVVKARMVTEIGAPPVDGRTIHLRLTAPQDELVVGEYAGVALLCEQFGNQIVAVNIYTVDADEAEWVNCSECIAAMHA